MSRFYEIAAYSFADVTLALAGPNNLNFYITGEAEEGISIEFEGNKNTMTPGAGGDIMHSLRAAQPGRLIIRLLQTSSCNAVLSNAWSYQTASAATHGQMTATVNDPVRGDLWSCLGTAFGNHANGGWATVGGMREWALDVGRVIPKLGAGTDYNVSA